MEVDLTVFKIAFSIIYDRMYYEDKNFVAYREIREVANAMKDYFKKHKIKYWDGVTRAGLPECLNTYFEEIFDGQSLGLKLERTSKKRLFNKLADEILETHKFETAFLYAYSQAFSDIIYPKIQNAKN